MGGVVLWTNQEHFASLPRRSLMGLVNSSDWVELQAHIWVPLLPTARAPGSNMATHEPGGQSVGEVTDAWSVPSLQSVARGCSVAGR